MKKMKKLKIERSTVANLSETRGGAQAQLETIFSFCTWTVNAHCPSGAAVCGSGQQTCNAGPTYCDRSWQRGCWPPP